MNRMTAEAGMSDRSMRRIIHDDIGMSPYRLRRRHFISDLQKSKRLARCRILLRDLQHGTDVGEVVFSDEKLFSIEASFNSQNHRVIASSSHQLPSNLRVVARMQKPAGVMVWAAVSSSWKSPLIFVPQGVKIDAKTYIESILVPMTSAAKEHFGDRPWTFQQDGASSHTAKTTQLWCKQHLPRFWSKEILPPSSPDLNVLDFCLWSVLESEACAKQHSSVEMLRASLTRAWDNISQEVVRAACEAFPKRLRAAVKAKGDHFE